MQLNKIKQALVDFGCLNFFILIVSLIFTRVGSAEEKGFQLIENDRELVVFSFASNSQNSFLQAQDEELGRAVADVLYDELEQIPFVQNDHRIELFSYNQDPTAFRSNQARFAQNESRAIEEDSSVTQFGYNRYENVRKLARPQKYVRLRVRRIESIPSSEKTLNELQKQTSDYVLIGGISRHLNNNEVKIKVHAILTNVNNGREKTFQATFSKNVLDELYPFSQKIIRYLAGTPLVEISIDSDPSGHLAYLDNYYFGETPIRRLFPTGSYELQIRNEGNVLVTEQLTFSANTKQPINLHYRLPITDVKMPITIDSIPSGAKVYLNEKYLGITPITVSVFASQHVLRLKNSGYHDLVKYLDIKPNQEFKEQYRLKKDDTAHGPFAEDYFRSANGMLYTFLGFYFGWIYFNIQGNQRVEQERITGSSRNATSQYNLANISAGLAFVSLIAATALFVVALDSDKYAGKRQMSFGGQVTEQGYGEFKAAYQQSF